MSSAVLFKNKISKLKPGTVFCANDFSSIGSRGNVNVILHRLSQSGFIRQLGVGLYDKPKVSALLGDLSPNIADIINAYMRKTGHILVLSPLDAANALGLTTQVPAQITFLTSGKSDIINICGLDIKFIHTSPKKMAGAGTSVGVIIQALQYFGKKMIPKNIINIIAKRLSDQDIKILKDIKYKTLQYIIPQIDRIIAHDSY